MIPPELEKLFQKLDSSFKKEGGSVLGLAGISRLDYFAAHAPPAPDCYIEERCKAENCTGMSARADWAWEYARLMIDQKPALEEPAPEGMYVVVGGDYGKVYARASTREKAQAMLEAIAKKEMTNATSFRVEGPEACPTCGHGSPGAGTVARPPADPLTPPK